MKNKKRAFTLVELLAVVVILAIILVIAIPQIMNVIKQTRMSSFKDSAMLIAEQADKDYLSQQVLNPEYNVESIPCSDVAKLNNSDYESCEVVYNNGISTVTLVGSGKFDGIICIGTKDNMECGKDEEESNLEPDAITITFNATGGNVNKTNKKVNKNSTYGILPTPTKDGYTFLGWSAGLPDEYQGVDYIKFTNNTYIDTGLVPTNHTIEMSFYPREYDAQLFGSVATTNCSTESWIYHWGITTNDRSQLGINCSYKWVGGASLNERHTIIFNDENNNAILDGNIVANVLGAISQSNLYIGGRPNGAKSRNNDVYYVKIIDKSTNKVVRNMIPCYRKSDNVIGMYDLIERKFYENVGTGTVDKGNNVDTLPIEILNSLSLIVNSNTKVISNENHILYALWGHNPTVTFNANGGTVNVTSKTYNYNSNYTDLPTSTRNDYTFLGWSAGLPVEYQAVEYVKFNDNTYIDTELAPTNHTIEISFYPREYDATLFGSKTYNGCSTESWIYHWGITSNDRSQLGINCTYKWVRGASLNERHTIIFNDENGNAILDGNIIDSVIGATSQSNLYIGGRPNGAKSRNNDVYYVKITDKSTKEIVRYMIPCYRKSDNLIGLYDLVEGKFHENIGTGTLDKGSVTNSILDEALKLILPTVNSNTKVISNENHTLYAVWGHNPTVTFNANGGTVNVTSKTYNYNSNYTDLPTPVRNGYTFLGWKTVNNDYILPNEYQEVEYIKFNKGNYIDTEIVPNDHTVEVEFDFLEYSNDERLFGTSKGANYYHFTAYSNKYYLGKSGSEVSAGSWSTGIHKLIFNNENNSVILDNDDLATNINSMSTTNLWIGKRDNTSNLDARIYYFKIIDKSTGKVVRNMIPCYRKSDNVIGMYDLIDKEFYENIGTGTFNKGNNINKVTTSDRLITNENHTLYAAWKEN